LQLDPVSGEISGTPTAVAASSHRVLVTITNQGQRVSGAILAQVDIASPVYISYRCDVFNAQVGVPQRCEPTYYNNSQGSIDGARYRYVLSEGVLPAGFTLDPDTGVVAGTALAAFTGTNTYTATVTLNGAVFDVKALGSLSIGY
jgi:hypothetical protein